MLLSIPLALSISGLLLLFLNPLIVYGLFYDDKINHLAYAHFFGSIKQIGNYQIVFQPLPFVPFASEDSTLNFSILDKNNANAYNVYAALTIKDKTTGSNSNYMVNGDPIYQGKPLIATFDLSVGNPTLSISFDRHLCFMVFQPRGCFYNSIFVPQTIL